MNSSSGNHKLWDVAEVELVYKYTVKPSQRPLIQTSLEAYNLIKCFWDDGKIDLIEEFKVVLLNRANRVLGLLHLSKGSSIGTVADPRLIFVAAIKGNAVSILIAHNHPSGNLLPSRADEELTHKINEAGRMLDIKLLDHLILSSEGYYSFRDEGIL